MAENVFQEKYLLIKKMRNNVSTILHVCALVSYFYQDKMVIQMFGDIFSLLAQKIKIYGQTRSCFKMKVWT